MNSLSAKHISEVIGLLNEKADYAVLRNFEELPDKNKSRDIDIIITQRSYRAVKDELVRLIDSTGWRILTYLHSDRLITYVCAKQSGEITELVQWDFFMNTSVWGILLMDADEFLVHKQFNGFLYYVGMECQFLDKYLYHRAVGSPFPEKYAWMKELAGQSPFVNEKIKAVFHTKTMEECDCTGKHVLLMRAVAANLSQRPLAFIVDILIFHFFNGDNFIHFICQHTS